MLQTQYKTYPGRFYVLVVTSLLAMQQNIAWLTFGPIPEQAKLVYGLTDVEMTLFQEYSPIAFMLLTVPFTAFLHRYGLRVSGVGGAWLLALGCGIRVFVPYVPNAQHWLWVMHIGHVLIGIVGIPYMIMPSIVSATWFPSNQRSFATAIMAGAQGLGSGTGFLMIAFLTEQYGLRTMLYVQAELGLFVAILASIYFPPAPPTPPSPSAEEDRTEFLEALKRLMLNRNFILLILSGGAITGGVFAFGGLIGIVLNPSSGFNNLVVVHSVDDFFSSIAWMGTISTILGTIGGQITGFFADRFQRRFKLILLVLLSLATAFCLWFSLAVYGYVSQHPVNYFVSYVLLNLFTLCAFPIFYEAIVECTYPVSEGTSVAGLTFTVNASTLLFGIIGMAHVFSDEHPERAKAMTWVMTGLGVVSTILVLIYSDKYHRLKVDKQITTTSPSIQAHHVSPAEVQPPALKQVGSIQTGDQSSSPPTGSPSSTETEPLLANIRQK